MASKIKPKDWTGLWVALQTGATLSFCSIPTLAEPIAPTEFSNPELGYIEYETDYCKASVELPLTLKGFARDKFDALLAEGEARAIALCSSAAAQSRRVVPYQYQVFWKTIARVNDSDVIALGGTEFLFNSDVSGVTTVKSIVYDRSIDRELDLEDLFVSRELMLERLVPAARAALAEYERKTAGVLLSAGELEQLLPDGMHWPGMQWFIDAAPKGYRFSGVQLWFPKGSFSSVGDRDLRGSASSLGSARLVLPKSAFFDALRSGYRAAFTDKNQ